MKRISLIFLILTHAISFSIADEIVDTYAELYRQMPTNVEQLGVLQRMIDQNVAGAGDFYVAALRRLISEFPNLRWATQIGAANAQALLLAEVLGEEKKLEAANDLWYLTELFSRDTRMQSTVMIALGKMQEPTHFRHILETLERINNAAFRPDDLNNEIRAHAAIIALELYGDPRAYLTIYFASIGWYSSWVKNQAIQSMQKIAEDSSPFMVELIVNPAYGHEIKLGALQVIEASDLPDDKKAEIAVLALDMTWKMPTTERGTRVMINQSRKLALTMLGKYGVPDDSVYSLIDHCYIHAADNTERLDVIITLVKLASDDSARILGYHLMEMNVKRISNTLTNEDLNLTRFLIEALGDIRNPNAIPILNVTASLDWTDSIKNLAEAALRQIEGN